MDFALQPEYRAQRRRRRLSKAQEVLESSMSRLSMEAPTYSSGRQHCRRKPRFSHYFTAGWWPGPVGHHSFEDFHQQILATYRFIRQHTNISLVAGSGFGAADDVWPYITGVWSISYDVQPMPFDGVLLASRVMVAKEAHTSASVKDLIVAAPGVDDRDWEGTYTKPGS